MEEDIRPSDEERRAVYEKGFRIWQSLKIRAAQESSLPQTCFQIQPLLQHLPHFPDGLDLKHSYNRLSASGTSIWMTSQGPCNMPPLERQIDITVSVDCPTRLTLSTELDQSSLQKCFNSEENHISVLIFAWSYILSARWVQLMPETTVLAYTDSQAKYNGDGDELSEQDYTIADIGDVDDNAERWWAAILAPGEGWEAYITTTKQDKFRSPWSITLPTNPKFRLSCRKIRSLNTAVPFETAVRFLLDYCSLHDIIDQSYAALSAVLFLPVLNGKKDILLPKPTLCRKGKLKSMASKGSVQLDLAWIQEAHSLDKLLTISCNTRGIKSLLSSIFYEPGIACNVVNPWLQSIFAIINTIEEEDNYILAYILMSRISHLAFLWLGGMITGIQKDILREGQFGLIPIDLHAAMWTGTIQSFLQEPIYPTEDNSILRSNECRLLYITQEENHIRWPFCQWMPFGATALDDTEIDVRVHSKCAGHGLRYAGWKWACRDGRISYQACDPPLVPASPPVQRVNPNITVSYEALNRSKESASANDTRIIFTWLRVEGCPPQEMNIFKHEWVDIEDSDDEKSSDKCSEASHAASRTAVEYWIDRIHDLN